MSQLKDDAVALVDVFAPTDFILNSPIGCADGQVNICNLKHTLNQIIYVSLKKSEMLINF